MCFRRILMVVLLILSFSCVKDANFDALSTNCNGGMVENTTFMDLKKIYKGEVVQIQEDLIIKAYVISSDKTGNFFGTLHLQNDPQQPSEGIQMEMDLRDSHLFYPVGSTIFIKLKGLYLGKRRGIFSLGGVFSAFGNLSIGRLPRTQIAKHIERSCESDSEVKARSVTIQTLDDSMVNTLVRLNGMEFVNGEMNIPFAIPRESTVRTLQDCSEAEIELLTSGFSDFHEIVLPDGNGAITGVLLRDNNNYQLVVRSMMDIDFSNSRCAPIIDEFTSNAIFISELADPDNNSGARFVELYNADSTPLSLNGWTLQRYTNANTEVSSIVELPDKTIEGESTFVISPNESEFEKIYGFLPDMAISTNSPADSNGDDTILLVDPFGVTIDIFGVIGEDGSGTNHEFEDGRAVRNNTVFFGNPSYDFNEWTIYNDTGAEGTIDQIQNAPEDFRPGQRD